MARTKRSGDLCTPQIAGMRPQKYVFCGRRRVLRPKIVVSWPPPLRLDPLQQGSDVGGFVRDMSPPSPPYAGILMTGAGVGVLCLCEIPVFPRIISLFDGRLLLYRITEYLTPPS